jgi:hypothetical protein
MKLSKDQIKTIQAAFDSYPKNYEPKGKFDTMDGIYDQLKQPSEKDGNFFVFYIDNVRENQNNNFSFSVNKMEVSRIK